MKKILSAVAIGMSLLSWAVAPVVRDGSVKLYRPNGRNIVYIDYILDGAPAVVTAEIYSQGKALGLAKSSSVSGDVSRVVKTGACRIVWNAVADYPDRVFTNAQVKVKAWATNAPPDFLAVDLDSSDYASAVRWYDGAESVPGGITNDIYKTQKLLMRKIPAAGVTWMMGSPVLPSPEPNRKKDMETPHYVTLTKDYYMGVYPVTVGQYTRVVGSIPNNADVRADPIPLDAELHPVSGVSYAWQDEDYPHYLRMDSWPENTSYGAGMFTLGFLGTLSKRFACLEIDLPTSAQWEFACRAGSDGAVYGGYSPSEVAWCSGETNRTVAVGRKKPNAYDLYDMLGNVWEWCLDIYPKSVSDTPVTDAPQIDPKGISYDKSGWTAANQVFRCRRGGNYASLASEARAANCTGRLKTARDSMLGFRVKCSAVAK